MNYPEWIEAVKVKGHIPIEEDGYYYYEDFGNNKCGGIICQICHDSWCVHGCDDINKISICDGKKDREYIISKWIFARNMDRTGYQKFTKENKLRFINEWRKSKGLDEV